MSDKAKIVTYYREDMHAQGRMPFPVVMGGIGLLLALVSPGGLSGGQGFLIGFIIGILAPGIVTLYSTEMKDRKARLAKEVEMALAKLQANTAAQGAAGAGRSDERSGEIVLGEGVK